MIKTAMIMAAGHGTRMRPLTHDRSKAMVELAGRPLIDHMIDRLLAVGVTRIIVNVHAFADHLEAHLKTRQTDFELIISDERNELLETGGGVVKALPLLGDGPIFICNIDAVWLEKTETLAAMIKAWDADVMDDLLLLAPIGDTMGYNGKGDFSMDADRSIAWRDGDSAPYVYAGVQIARLEPLRGYKVEPFSRTKVWRQSVPNNRAFGHILNGFWMHVGDPQARNVAEGILADEWENWA
ncbi:nucleotidyltransferase family protein [Fretibacter rubidus]|uniref:nucleotidyltransferase family protein n=1 Tax=Fretibacter rubidus TaxID=570162 RepID=UPI00352A0885